MLGLIVVDTVADSASWVRCAVRSGDPQSDSGEQSQGREGVWGRGIYAGNSVAA